MISARPSINELSRQIRQLEHSRVPNDRSWAFDAARLGRDVISSGVLELDALLPLSGFRTGTITEWLNPNRGCGVSTLTLCLAAHCVRDDQVLAIVDLAGDFYPPAAADLGIDLRKTVVIRPSSKSDCFWTLEQLLRSSAIGAVWCNLDRLASTKQSPSSTNQSFSPIAPVTLKNSMADNRLFRRLQLASEKGDSICFLVRPMSARPEPSWADLRFLTRPPEHRYPGKTSVIVELLRSRDSFAQGEVTLYLPHVSGLSKVDEQFHPIAAAAPAIGQVDARLA
jgi:cell division inhibitor SulA/protein ImuA